MAGPDVVARTIVQRGGNQRVLTLLQPWILGLDDDQFFLYDGTDETKRVRFQLEDIPTETDVTFRFAGTGGTVAVSGSTIQTDTFVLIANGQGSPLSPGVVGDLPIFYPCVIVEAIALATSVGSLVADWWMNSIPNYPPTNADSITGSSPVTISTNDHSYESDLPGWSTDLHPFSSLRLNIDSCSGITQCTFALTVQRFIGD